MSRKVFLILGLFLIAVTSSSFTAAQQAVRGTLDDTPRTAILSAFGAELDAFKASATIEQTVTVNGRSVYLGKLAGLDVLMTLSGGSMTNAAMSTQAILDHFNVSRIVFSGIAGGVNPDLQVGDVAVPAKWAEYQENFFVREVDGKFVPPSWAVGFLTLPNYGMMFPQGAYITTVNGEADKEASVSWFNADPDMITIAQTVADTVTLNRCTPDNVCLTHEPTIKVGGQGVSGPTFVDNAAYREYVWTVWSADALDMESAAVAHVATVNAVPFIIFRSLSDLAGGGPGENEVQTFFALAADNSSRVMIAFLQALSAAS